MSLLQMSFTGGVLIAVITVLRAATLSRLPKKAFLALWAVALARLLVPFSLPSACSVYTYVEPAPQIRPVPVRPAQPEPVVPAAPAPDPEPGLPVKTVVWAAGAGACFLSFAITYWKSRREFNASLPVEDGPAQEWLSRHKLRRSISLRQSDRISAPLTYGVFRPVILMPKITDWTNLDRLQYVLAHELVHIRRFDAATKLALAGTVCVHWFNPLVWVMYLLANRDLELSCDEAVVRQFGMDARSAYAMALIGMEEQRSGFSGLYSYFNKNAMEERITAIMKTKKLTVPALCAALSLIIGITAAFATSALPDQKAPGTIPGFTPEENGILSSIWTDGYEDLTVAEYRDKMLKLRDAPEVEALFARLDEWLKTEEAGEARRNDQALNEFVMGYLDLYKPLLYGDTYVYSGAFYETASSGQKEPFVLSALEYEYQLSVINPQILTVRNYNDARLDIFDALSRAWDGSGQIDAVLEECERLTVKWSSENLAVFVTAVCNPDGDGPFPGTAGALSQTWDSALAPYLPFGLSFEFDPQAAMNGSGLRMYYQGREVRGIVDGGSWVTESAGITRFGADAVELYAVRDAQGNLTGLRFPTDGEQASWTEMRTRNSQQLEQEQNGQEVEPRKSAPGTKADYESLFDAVMITGYKQLTLEEFNALLLNWADAHFDAYESILEDVGRGEYPLELSAGEREFLTLTVPLSMEENYRRIQSLKTGEPEEDPWYSERSLYRSDGEWAWCSLWYRAGYHVWGTCTVAERDSQLKGLAADIEAFFYDTEFNTLVNMSENEVVAQMRKFAENRSGRKLAIRVSPDQAQFEAMDERSLMQKPDPELPQEAPGLTAAVGDGGIEGYIREQDILDGVGPAPDVLYLYDRDENVIGTFTMSNGEDPGPAQALVNDVLAAMIACGGDTGGALSGAAEQLGAEYAQGLLWQDYDENWNPSPDGAYRLTAQGVPPQAPGENRVRIAVERDGTVLYEQEAIWEWDMAQT